MLNSIEIKWSDVQEFPNLYKVSTLGTVASYRKTLSINILNSGYQSVQFKVDGKNINRLVHRLVANAFIPNIENKKEVNHIDGNKLNNIVTNLEWVTSSENKIHARDTGLKIYNNPTKGIKLSNKSKYYNVGFDNNRKLWRATVRHEGVNYFQKRFKTEEEAALHVNWILDELQLFDRPRNIL